MIAAVGTELDRDALGIRRRPQGLERRVDHRRQRNLGLGVQPEFAVGDSRHVEQIVDQTRLTGRSPSDGIECLRHQRRVAAPVLRD